MYFWRKWFLPVAANFSALFGTTMVALAVDETPIGERMSVVGVIAESTPAGGEGIAVLKDRRGGRTFAVKTGETVPGEPAYEVKSVRRNAVVVSNGSSQVTLTYFDETPAEPVVAQVQPSSDAANGKFFWVGGSDTERRRAQERMEANGIAAGWEQAGAGDAGFSVTINNGTEDVTDYEAGDELPVEAAGAAEWYDTSDTAAEIIERLTNTAERAPRYEPVDAVPPPVSTYIE